MRETEDIYHVYGATEPLELKADWMDPVWANAHTVGISHFRPESSTHRPITVVRLLHDTQNIHGIFRVDDRYVRCTHIAYQSDVWKDSCVEFFAQPRPDFGYFNFEFNCGGAFLCSYIVNPERTKDGFKEYTRLPEQIGSLIRVRSSLPAVIEPEMAIPLPWILQFSIPFTVFEEYVGPLGSIPKQRWRGNFFKCAEENSRPHWASWSPVDEFNFHLPRCFGALSFE
jgi:hypothetical protein